jgi:hypothetical protein
MLLSLLSMVTILMVAAVRMLRKSAA